MITEDYVSLETAKLLKEKGFDEDIDLWYDENGYIFFQHKYNIICRDWRVRQNLEVYQCPTLQMAMRWLRETYHLYIQFVLNQDVIDEKSVIENYYHFNVSRLDRFANEGGDCKWYKSYKEACEAAIKYCLENLI